MFVFFFPVMCLVVLLASPKPNKNFKVLMTGIFLLIIWTLVYCHLNGIHTAFAKALAIGLYSFSLFLLAKVLVKSQLPSEQVSFSCPFCENYVSFDKFNLDRSKHCPECNEVVTVTEDEEIHKASKEAHAEILAAMNSEDLQESPESLSDPSMAPSVFGFQFELKKGAKEVVEDLKNP